MNIYRCRRWRAQVLLTVFLSGAACTSWRVEQLTPDMLQNRAPQELKIMRLDSSVVRLDAAQIRGDTVIGNRQGQDVRIPLDSVLQTSARRGSVGKTLGLFLGMAAGAFLALVIAYGITCSNNACST